MVSVAFCVYDSVVLIDTIIKMAHMYAILLDNTTDKVTTSTQGTIITEPNITENPKSETTTPQYARHWLCKDIDAQKYFYKVLKNRFCSLPLEFISKHVIDLCSKSDYFLDKWALELFDIDGDGYISHLERNYYKN